MAVVKKNVIPMPARPSAAAAKMSERKWGREVMDVRGFCLFPSLLLQAQARLKMTPTHLALVLHLADFWWDANRKPWATSQHDPSSFMNLAALAHSHLVLPWLSPPGQSRLHRWLLSTRAEGTDAPCDRY